MASEDRLREYLKRVTVELTETRRKLAEAEQARTEPVAIVGMSCRYPGGGDTVPGFWDLLRDGRSGVVEVPAARWNVDDYYDPDRRATGGMYTRHGSFLPDIAGCDAEFFGLSPQEALRMDPQQRMLMELIWEGLEDSGIAPSRIAGSRTGVLVGFMDSVQYGRLQSERYGPGIAADPYFGQGVSASVVAGRLAYHFDLRGPAVTLDTACSSSLVGVHLAAQALRRGECDLAVAAGAFLIIQPDTYVQACATSMLAPDGRCKTFDSSADGYVMGEGGGLVVLERLSSAVRNGHRIRAVLRGSAVNQDGRSNGLTAPSRSAQVDVIRQALAAARVDPADVDYVEAHGSGTQLGDAIELTALHDVFADRTGRPPLHVGAVKTNIGHTQSAAGVAGLIKAVLALEHGTVPANLHLADPAGAIPADGTIRPVTQPVEFPDDGTRRIAGVSSFGWSGTNAHLVLQTAPTEDEQPVRDGARVLPVSAVGGQALHAQLERLATWLGENPGLSLADVAHTLTVGRAEHDHRWAVPCTDLADAVARLSTATDGVRAKKRPRVAFLLPGTGDQYAGLGRELYRTEPVYAAAVDRCVELLDTRCGVDLRPVLFPDTESDSGNDLAALLGREKSDGDPLDRAELAHPFLFTVQYALATLLAHWGVRPDLLVGYSLGEYVAACLAGVFTLSDALSVVVERARLISAAPEGRMVAVAADERTVRAVINGAEVDVAALNGPAMTVLSGMPADIDRVSDTLRAEGLPCQPLRTVHAFHSALLEPARDKLATMLAAVPMRPPATTIVSNRTGAALSAEEATSREYWSAHLVSPVRFADGVRFCAEQDVDVFVELGAGQALGSVVRQNLTGGRDTAILGTLPTAWNARSHQDQRTDLLTTCARLWEIGVPVDWAATGNDTGRIVSLPTYPFQRTRFWPEGGEIAAPVSRPRDLAYAPSWRHDVTASPRTTLDLPGPLVVFADQDGIGSRLADLAEAGGVPVVEVVPGTEQRREGRRITVDPAVPEHARAVFADLPGDGPVHIAHLWSIRAGERNGDRNLRDAIRFGFDGLLHAVQSLGELPTKRGVRLLTVSRGATEILGADIPAPHRSIGHGLGRVVHHEYAGLDWAGVDLDPDAGNDAEQLAHELLVERGDAHPGVVGWRRGRRWLPDWTELSTTDIREPRWRSDGVYLITGGTRGLGMALARHLVRSGVRRLALVGRTPLRHAPVQPDERISRALRDIAELEADGAQVLLLTADTGKPDELRAALRECRAHFGALHGVVHAAGLPAGGMTQRRTAAEAGAVLAPKVLAMGPLAELVGPDTPAEDRPELLVLYSSAVTAFGGIGEGDYCAANTVLDAYGAALAATAPTTKVVSIAWGPWLHDDWQTEGLSGTGGAGAGLAERAAQYRRTYGFTDEAGCALLDRLTGAGHGTVIAVRQPMADALREWSATLDIDALVTTDTASATPRERFPRPRLRTEFVAPRTDVETAVADIWGAYLGIDQIGVHDPFFDLGGNSLVGMAMVRAIEKKFDRGIAPAVLFEHPTVAEFAAAIDSDSGEQAGEELLTSSSARGQRRRRARPGGRK